MSGADVIEKRIKAATEGMPSSKACYDKGNGVIIADYLLAYKLEVNVKDSTRDTVCDNLELFIRKVNKPFRDVTRQDVLLFLSSLKKSEDEDPRHKWIGSCNLFSTHIRQFFKWFYYKEDSPTRRQIPAIVDDLPTFRRPSNEKTYDSDDMWSVKDNEVFLRRCPDPRIKCYHAIAASTGARPHDCQR